MKDTFTQYTYAIERRDYYRVATRHCEPAIAYRHDDNESGVRNYTYFDLNEDRKMNEYKRLAVYRRLYGIVRLDRYRYYQPAREWTR